MEERHEAGYGGRDDEARSILWRGDAGTVYQVGEAVRMDLNREATETVGFEDFVRATFGDEAREAIREDLRIARDRERELADA